MPINNDFIGKRFGKLVVQERDLSKPIGHGHASYWICQCDCGNIKSVSHSQLTSGKTKSCGCLRKELLREKNTKDLTNQRFGMLTAKENTGKQNKHHCYIWRCECECGNKEYYCSTEDLCSGKVNSCGCKHKSLGEAKIEQLLIQANLPFNKQQTFSDLKSTKGYYLRYDFAILNKNNEVIRLIEFDGEQHFNERSLYYLTTTVENDIIKNNYAINHSIDLIRIPYSALNDLTIESLLDSTYLLKI